LRLTFRLRRADIEVFDVNTVRNGYAARRTRAIGRIAGAALMLALWMGALVFASSARLHSEVCPDAKESSHQCAFTSIAQGQFTAPPGPLTLAADAPVCLGNIFPAAQRPASSADMRLAPSRAPPFFFVLLL
jgi:hypothetical protein